MKRKQRKITDISFDVLRHIMLYLSKSSSGAKNLSRTLAVCRVFEELAEDPVILKAVTFDDVKLSEIQESFWQFNGLLFRCIRAGNQSTLGTALKYSETIVAAFETIKGDLHRAEMNLTTSFMEFRIISTRARLRALKPAFDDLQRVNNSADECYKKALVFLEALKEAERSASRVRA